MKHIALTPLCLIIFLCSCKGTNSNEKDTSVILKNLIQSFETKGYPEYYGGSYIKDKTLFIFASKNNIQVRKELEKRGKGTNFFIRTLSINSVGDISKELDSLSLDFYSYPNLKYYSHYIDNKTRKIIVMIGDTTKESLDFFKFNIIESPYIKFEYTSPIVAE